VRGSTVKRRRTFIVIVCAVVALCSMASHVAVGWLGIRASWGTLKHYGRPTPGAMTLLHSSSPGYDAVDWDRVSDLLGEGIQSWATPGSSPAEWELMHFRSPQSNRVIVALSAYDLNEYFLCDFRANIVPLSRTVRDLAESNTEWPFSRRIVTQYAVTFVRRLFPTIGRSDGVMVGVRAKLQRIVGVNTDASEMPAFATTGKSVLTERLSEVPEARFQRRLLSLGASVGVPSFNGPKKLALHRLLERATAQGPVVILIIPNSPAYRAAFMPPPITQRFDDALAEVAGAFPHVPIVRLDRSPELESDEYFSDFVHMNMYGQEIATERVLQQLQLLTKE
jgi:hypothetical protein